LRYGSDGAEEERVLREAPDSRGRVADPEVKTAVYEVWL